MNPSVVDPFPLELAYVLQIWNVKQSLGSLAIQKAFKEVLRIWIRTDPYSIWGQNVYRQKVYGTNGLMGQNV